MERSSGKGDVFGFNSPCDVCTLRPRCNRPCWMLARLMGASREGEDKVSKRRVYGYYFSSVGLTRRQLKRHIDRLTPRQREMAALYYFEERSVQEVADTLGVTKGAVSRCLARARKTLTLAVRA